MSTERPSTESLSRVSRMRRERPWASSAATGSPTEETASAPDGAAAADVAASSNDSREDRAAASRRDRAASSAESGDVRRPGGASATRRHRNGAGGTEPAPESSSVPVEFECVGEKERGYAPEEVRDFFAEARAVLSRHHRHPDAEPRLTSRSVREKTFPAEAGGCAPAPVDEALAELEDQLAEAENRRSIARGGLSAHRGQAQRLADVVMGRLGRADGERFRRPAKRRTMGYLTKDVDAWCQELTTYLRDTEKVSPEPARGLSFRLSSGRHAYDEAQVDAFVGRVVDLLHMLRAID